MRNLIVTIWQFCAATGLLFVLLFVQGIPTVKAGIFGSPLNEGRAFISSRGTQWIVAGCLIGYVGAFLTLRQRRSFRDLRWSAMRNWDKGSGFWLLLLVLLAFLRYSIAYQTASTSSIFLVLLASIAFGEGSATWARRSQFTENRKVQRLIGLLVGLLLCATFWHAGFGEVFGYQAIERWRGPWENPNVYGLLMGIGVVMAGGEIIQSWGIGWEIENGKWQKMLSILMWSFAAAVCGIGLFKSYSRGAWIATGVGISYLIFQISRSASILSPRSSVLGGVLWISRYWRVAVVIGVSLAVMSFWQFRFTEWRPARRVFSVANINDFSWRNRVTACEGAIRMMADKPLTGYGWGQAEAVYGTRYCPSQLDDGAAIQMNDYFMLGISAGLPALVCFLLYVGLALRSPQPLRPSVPTLDLTRATCRAGAIVLLVGFWFDGGLFKLATGSVFWILLELGRVEPRMDTNSSASDFSATSEHELKLITQEQRNEKEIHTGRAPVPLWLKWAAVVLAALALVQTIVLVGIPFLPVTRATLAIARHWLVPPKAVGDLDLLTAETAACPGMKLRFLLQHASLANYNRQLVNWSLDDEVYWSYVLWPDVYNEEGRSKNAEVEIRNRLGDLNWRRELWEYFYPSVRHETDRLAAAEIVVTFLRQRVTTTTQGPVTIEEMWRQRKADTKGFEALTVAAFRAVGIPARLNQNSHAEFFAGGKWQAALL